MFITNLILYYQDYNFPIWNACYKLGIVISRNLRIYLKEENHQAKLRGWRFWRWEKGSSTLPGPAQAGAVRRMLQGEDEAVAPMRGDAAGVWYQTIWYEWRDYTDG